MLPLWRPRREGVIFIATLGYLGYSPVAPGTVGSLVGILFYWLTDITPLTSSVLILLLFPLGVLVSEEAEKILQRRDAPQIVIDELVGMFLSISFLPKRTGYIIGGFLLFRFFDIVKPFPIRGLEERTKGGLGIMLDDVISAIYTNLILQAIRFFL